MARQQWHQCSVQRSVVASKRGGPSSTTIDMYIQSARPDTKRSDSYALSSTTRSPPTTALRSLLQPAHPPTHPSTLESHVFNPTHLSMWRSRPCRMTTTLSPGNGKVRGHAASMAYFRNACGTIGMIAVRSAELRYTDTSESAGMQSIPAQMLKCSRTVPCCPGSAAAAGVTALCCCPHLSRQQVGSRAHVLLQGRGVQQQVPQVTTGGHRPGGEGGGVRTGEAAT